MGTRGEIQHDVVLYFLLRLILQAAINFSLLFFLFFGFWVLILIEIGI